MTISMISFFVALIGIISMIVVKSIEIKKDKKFFFARLALKSDHAFQSAYDHVRYFISHVNKHNAIALIQWIAYHILSWLRSLYISLHRKAHAHPHSKKVIDMVRGKGEITKLGGASFYLKRISEDSSGQIR